MSYQVEIKPRARKDLASLDPVVARRVVQGLRALENLAGDIKRLKTFEPRYRLRIGDYRILFDLDGERIIVYRVVHRRQAYDR